MTAIEEMAGMDVLCSDKTGTLTLNKLSVDKNLIEVGSELLHFLTAVSSILIPFSGPTFIWMSLCRSLQKE